MGRDGHGAVGLTLRFSLRLIAASGALVLLGWLPTSHLGGKAGIEGMLAGCGVSLVASLLGSLPVTRPSGEQNATQKVTRLLAATGIRMAIEIGLVLTLALSGAFHKTPLVIWAAISYLALLPLDTSQALQTFRQS